MKKRIISKIGAMAIIAFVVCTGTPRAIASITVINNSPCECDGSDIVDCVYNETTGDITITCSGCGSNICEFCTAGPGHPSGGGDTVNYALVDYAYNQIQASIDTGSFTGPEPAIGDTIATVTWNATASISGNYVITETW